jgi:hypothetical protein
MKLWRELIIYPRSSSSSSSRQQQRLPGIALFLWGEVYISFSSTKPHGYAADQGASERPCMSCCAASSSAQRPMSVKHTTTQLCYCSATCDSQIRRNGWQLTCTRVSLFSGSSSCWGVMPRDWFSLLVKAALSGARMVHVVLGPRAEPTPAACS